MATQPVIGYPPVVWFDILTAGTAAGGGFNPLTSIPWKYAWWADDPGWAGKPANGATFTSWPGAIGGQAFTATTPPMTYRSAVTALNNRAGIDVSAAGCFPVAAATDTPQPATVVVIFNLASAVTNFMAFDTASGGRQFLRPNWSSKVEAYAGTVCDFGTAVVGPGAFLTVTTINGATSTVRINTTTYSGATIGNPGTNTLGGLKLGSAGGVNQLAGNIPYVAVIGRALTAQETTDLQTWAKTYYGINT